MSDECKRCGNERVTHCPACSEDIWTDVAVRDEALRIAKATIATLTTSLARVTAERDANHKVIARLQEIAMSITTDDDQPCVICGDTYEVDHGKDDTGFCHQCATETLAGLLATVVFPEAPQ